MNTTVQDVQKSVLERMLKKENAGAWGEAVLLHRAAAKVDLYDDAGRRVETSRGDHHLSWVARDAPVRFTDGEPHVCLHAAAGELDWMIFAKGPSELYFSGVQVDDEIRYPAWRKPLTDGMPPPSGDWQEGRAGRMDNLVDLVQRGPVGAPGDLFDGLSGCLPGPPAAHVLPKSAVVTTSLMESLREPVFLVDAAAALEIEIGHDVGDPVALKAYIERAKAPEVPLINCREAGTVNGSIGTVLHSMSAVAAANRPPFRSPILNSLSLEYSLLDLQGTLPSRPAVVDKVDLIKQATDWANERHSLARQYVIASMQGSFTDVHMDMGGTAVWYSVVTGTKLFLCVPPSAKALEALKNAEVGRFFIDSEPTVIVARRGQGVLLPSGFIHAVYTVEDSIVLGGNYIARGGIDLALRTVLFENETNEEKYRLRTAQATFEWAVGQMESWEERDPAFKAVRQRFEELFQKVYPRAAAGRGRPPRFDFRFLRTSWSLEKAVAEARKRGITAHRSTICRALKKLKSRRGRK